MWETPTQSSKINWPIFLDTQEAVISMILLLMTSSCWRRNDVWCNNNNGNNSNNDSTGNNHPSAAATKSRQPSPANFSGLQRNLGTSLSDRLKSKKDLFDEKQKKTVEIKLSFVTRSWDRKKWRKIDPLLFWQKKLKDPFLHLKFFKGKTRAKRISSFLKPRRRRKANNKEKRPLALFVAFSWDTK